MLYFLLFPLWRQLNFFLKLPKAIKVNISFIKGVVFHDISLQSYFLFYDIHIPICPVQQINVVMLIFLSLMSVICVYKEQHPKGTQADILVHFSNEWGFSVGRSTISDILRDKVKWLSVRTGVMSNTIANRWRHVKILPSSDNPPTDTDSDSDDIPLQQLRHMIADNHEHQH